MSLCAVTDPCLLLDLPRHGQAADAFEVHVTVRPLTPPQQARFRQVCRDLRVKAIVIELGDGIPSQPMTCSRIQGEQTDAHAEAERLQAALEHAGFTVTRTKIEAAPWNRQLPPRGYYEHHARLLLHDVPAQEPHLRDLCRTLGVHLSRNPFKMQDDASQQRFVTLRHGPTTRETATQRADTLWSALRHAGFTVEKTITEYCVYDNHRELDAAWEQP